MSDYAQQLAAELNLSAKNVQGAIDLIDQGNTIPFIARYRKEVTGSMDDQVLRNLGDRLEYLRGLDKRKEEVTSSITEQGAMTPELTAALSKAKTLAEVEDLTAPTSPSARPAPASPRLAGCNPWPMRCSSRTPPLTPTLQRRTISTRKSPMPPLRWPVPRTSSPRLFLTMPPAAPNCAATTAPSAASSASRPRMRTASTPSITTTPSR